jgi:DNA polymerase
VFVPSDGPDKAEVVLVGEAPGLSEAKEGRPFVGASGRLLNQVLTHSGIKREEVFITNVCLCRPRNNDNPPKDAVRACHSRLVQEIEAREPRVIVSLGNFASKSILNTEQGITKLRVGPAKETEVIGGDVEVIPTFHPAASLYNPSSFPDIVTDSCIKLESAEDRSH